MISNSDLISCCVCFDVMHKAVSLECGNNHHIDEKCAQKIYGNTDKTGKLLLPGDDKTCPSCRGVVKGYRPDYQFRDLVDCIDEAQPENRKPVESGKITKSENLPTGVTDKVYEASQTHINGLSELTLYDSNDQKVLFIGIENFSNYLKSDWALVNRPVQQDANNLFNAVPKEILQQIFSYTPESFKSFKQVSIQAAIFTDQVSEPLQEQMNSLFKPVLSGSNDQAKTYSSTARYVKLAKQLEEEIKLLMGGSETLSELRKKYSPFDPQFLQEVDRWIEEKNLLIVCNRLSNQQFASADEARKWINDSNNTQGIIGADLDGLGLTRLPKEIKNCKSLQRLYLDNNNLTSLPASIGNLKSLKHLFLHKNKLKTLPDSIGKLKSLEILSLNNNMLTTLPDSIGNLKSLEILSLNNNNFTALPASIGDLTSLEKLRLYNNKLTALPDSFGKLSKLLFLELGNNNLTVLPASIGEWESLGVLNLKNNKLTTLPASFGSLSKLRDLKLDGNNIDYDVLPEEIRNSKNEAIQEAISKLKVLKNKNT